MPPSVFDELVRLSQLSSMFAPAAMERALKRAGIEGVQNVTWRDVEKALPEIRRVLEPFMQERAGQIIADIERRARARA